MPKLLQIFLAIAIISAWQLYNPKQLIEAAPSFGPNLLVSDATTSFTSSNDGPPILDIDIAGGAYVAWIDHRNSQTEVFFSKLDPQSSQFTANTPLSGIADEKSFPQIEEDNGQIYIAWSEARVINNVVSRGVFFTKSTDGGQSFSEELFIDSDDSLPISMVAHAGKIFIVYSKTTKDIWLASSADLGTTFTKKKISDSTVGGRQRPVLDFAGDNVYAFWLDSRNAKYEVFFAKSSDSGANFGANRSIFNHPNSAIHLLGNNFGRLATRASGSTIFLAFDFYQQTSGPFTSDYEVYFTKSTDLGDNFSTATRLSDDDPSLRREQQGPSLALLPDGSPAIAWRDLRDGDKKLMLTYSDDKGETFTPNVRINNTQINNASSFPTIVADNEGKIHLVRIDISLLPRGVYYTKIDLGVNFYPVPYFSQKDPQWATQQYDHANSLSLTCGTTLAQCGCAVTSAAMILKYYGVKNSPTGESTNPVSLNNWLKTRQFGYINGDINWQEVTKYAKAANELYGTPKIDYLGAVIGENVGLLNSDLSLDKPVVLEEPGHFIVATGISGTTYTINDPLTTSKTTLQSYGNSFEGLRRFELTNTNLSAILLSIPSPGSILIVDSLGRKLGKDPDTGETFFEIPNGNYYLQKSLTDGSVESPPTQGEESGNYFIEILDPQAGDYTIKVSGENSGATFLGYDRNADVSNKTFEINGQQQFLLDYSPEPGSYIEVTKEIDIDVKPGSNINPINLKSNGVIPVAILTTPNFDAAEVDLSSIKFGTGETRENHSEGHYEDVDYDGDEDLVLHFKAEETGLVIGDTYACLTGQTTDGTAIRGCDPVQIVDK
jgi:hypothetical protein